MAAVFRAYMHQLRVNTLRTQMLTSFVVMGLGNVLTQQGVNKRGWAAHDWKATVRFSVYGCFFFTPVANRWHYLANRIKFDSLLRTTLTRLAIDMTLFAPFATSWFFLWTGLLEGRSLTTIRDRWQSSFRQILVRQWLVFGPAQVVNMTLVPVYARPPVMNLVGLGWSGYLSMVAGELERMEQRGEVLVGEGEGRRRELEVQGVGAAVME